KRGYGQSKQVRRPRPRRLCYASSPSWREEGLMSDGPTLTVLHVEDDERNRESLGKVLELKGCTVWPVATGAEALRRATEQPDVILLDVHLPDIDGYEVCRRLKADPVTA